MGFSFFLKENLIFSDKAFGFDYYSNVIDYSYSLEFGINFKIMGIYSYIIITFKVWRLYTLMVITILLLREDVT